LTNWRITYYALVVVFLLTAALNMLHVRAGFLTSYAADIVVPAWLYLASRGLPFRDKRTALQRTVGRTPESAALILFIASSATEVSQMFWPDGLFRGRFDPMDIAAYALGLAACYAAEKLSLRQTARKVL
jgi:hypothetical protein